MIHQLQEVTFETLTPAEQKETRKDYFKFFKVSGKNGTFYQAVKTKYQEEDKFLTSIKEKGNENQDLICSCGNDSFTLKYGCYEIAGKCANCGAEQTVYDG